MTFKVGQRVLVFRLYDPHNERHVNKSLVKSIGTVVRILDMKAYCLVGVSFSGRKDLHDFGGVIPTNSGQWVPSSCLTTISEDISVVDKEYEALLV